MFKSIFSKYFTIVVVVVLGSFVALCGMQMLLSTRYWVSEKQETLTESALTIADYTARNTRELPGQYVLEESFKPFFRLLASTDSNLSNVLITQKNGTVILCTEGESACAHLGQQVPEDIMTAVQQDCAFVGGTHFNTGKLGTLYEARQYTAAAPVNYNGETIGYVFVSTPTDKMTEYLSSNLQVFFLSAMGVLALTFIALYVTTYRLVRPPRRRGGAPRRFSVGDFSYRLPVKGKDEIAELAASLNSMAVSLSAVEGMSRSFVANVSHELKTPMTTIAGFIDGILDGTIPDEKRNYYLKIVSDEVKRLSRLVKSMLDLSRIDSGQLKLKPVTFDLTTVIGNALVMSEQRIDEKHITITGLEDCPPLEVYGDFDLIGQVVYNLLDNAIKFTNDGGEIGFRLEKRDGRTYFAIRNSGIGISAQELPHIFERFYKSDKSRSLDKKGVGLGLYIVKSVINLHGGEIIVRSIEGEYCEFEFWLPAPAENSARAQ